MPEKQGRETKVHMRDQLLGLMIYEDTKGTLWMRAK